MFEQGNDSAYKYLHEKGECLEMCYENSRGVKIACGGESMGRERRKGSRYFTELNLSCVLRNDGVWTRM